MASVPPSPNLGKSQALNVAQATVARLATIVPTLTTQLSPVTVYQPGATSGVGNELTASAGQPVFVNGSYGVWVAPDLLGNGQEYTVQVECFGAGGGGGGGNASGGGGGGGGGEYVRETYPVKPGASYAYVVGLPGTGGCNNITEVNPGSAGTNGGATLFDTDHSINPSGLANGVIANGGQGGDQQGIGIGGDGGTGSTNSVAFPGGAGGTNSSLSSSDDPMSLATLNGMFVGNTQSTSIIPCWYILNEASPTGGHLNDHSLNENSATVTNYSSGSGGIGMDLGAFTAPTEVPAFAAASDPPLFPAAQQTGKIAGVPASVLTHFTAQAQAPAFTFAGSKLTVSCWIQCDPSGTWGNTAGGSYAVIAANNGNFNGNALQGYALWLHQDGTTGAPIWGLYAAVGNGSSRTIVSTFTGLTPTPGTWYYVVMTYNSGTLTLYVNGTSIDTATSSGYTSVPSGTSASMLFTSPGGTANWFFGSIANIWWANDCATTTLIGAAFGGASPTGGAGGGASGGPSAAGGVGGSASGSTGGTAGTPATQPASLTATTTEAMSGYTGANGGGGFSMHKYGSTTTTVTQTAAGTYSQTLPENVTQITAAQCWGAGSGGSGGTTSGGGAGGSGGEFASETTYTVQANPFSYTVGSGGSNSSTGNGAGGNGGDSFIDSTGVYANGATNVGGTGSTNTTHHNGGTGGSASSTGGASGGNSGNSTAAGNAGVNSTSSTHGGAPAGQTGSGTGGAGGDSGSSASNGGSPGAGGGGAGSGSGGTTTLTKTYEAVYTASYYGPDAQNGNPNGLRSTSTLYQGGETASGGASNGNQRCIMAFNSDQIQEDFAGYTPTGLTLTITNEHSWYNSGMTVEFDVGNAPTKYPGSPPGHWLGNQNFLATGSIGEGDTHSYSLGAACASYFTNNETNFLGLGAFVAADHPYNLNYYGYFTGGHGTSLEITITGTKASPGSESSGTGSDGKVTFTYANEAPFVPPVGTTGGPYGGGGAGSGNMPASPALTVLTVPFATAAAYCGTDAASGPGTPYSLNQQNNPASGVTSVLFAGGAATDTGSGTKNSILLLPAGLQAMLGNGQYTVEQVFLTFTNAFPNNAVEPILELGYSSDTVLPQTYSGESLASYIGAIPIPADATTVTYDLSQSGIGGLMQNGTATALVIGPGATPSFDAYDSPYGPGFYCSIYGPGAYDAFGNAQFPYLTIILQKTSTVQRGSSGSGGAILITALDNENTFVSAIQPYDTVDANGNTMAAGYTGAVTVFDPGTPVATIQGTAGTDSSNNGFAAGYTGPVSAYTPGSSPLTVETWHLITKDATWANLSPYAAVQYRMLPDGNVQLSGLADFGSNQTVTKTLNSSNPLPAAYRPASQKYVRIGAGDRATIEIASNGVISAVLDGGTLWRYCEIDCIYSLV